MTLSLGPRARILAFGGLAAVLVLGAGILLLSSRQPGGSATAAAITPLHLRPAPHARRHAVAAKIRRRPPLSLAARIAAATGLPRPIADALAAHPVVVVSLFSSGAGVDTTAQLEASAGARLAGAGFVAVDALNDAQTRPLADRLGVLASPTLLVFRRPGKLVLRIAGFADRQTVAQAAANATP